MLGDRERAETEQPGTEPPEARVAARLPGVAAQLRAGVAPAPGDMLAVQRALGNRATARLARAVVQRTMDDATRYCANAKIKIPDQRSGEDWIDVLLRLEAEQSPHFAPLLDALVKDEEPGYATALQARVAEKRGSAPRAGAAVLHDAAMVDDDPEDGPYVDSQPQAQRPSHKRRAKATLPTQIKSYESFKARGEKKAKRRKTPITAELETIDHVSGEKIQRPIEISGFVEPGPTTGRPGAPEPISIKVGIKWKEVGNPFYRDTGIVDAQKGHIMALELGGPDQPWNIVPQWANWQGNGRWREVEKQVHKRAVAAQARGAQVHFHAEIFYKPYVEPRQGTRKGLTFPSGFRVTITESGGKGPPLAPEPMFYGEQSQDVTDYNRSEKQFAADDEVSASESESESDSESEGESDADME